MFCTKQLIMGENQDKPTLKFYGLFLYIFDHFNHRLFNNQLKDVVITITRQHNVFGHYIFKNWFIVEGKKVFNEDETVGTDEIALNPSMFTRFPLIEICQTIVHEMCHAWQHHYGNPSRPGYHNKEWAAKMMEVGLMPSHNGKVWGKTVGQHMADYPIEGSPFMKASEELLTGDVFAGLYIEANPALEELMNSGELPTTFDEIKDFIINVPKPKPKPQTRVKYSNNGCCSVWGKPGMDISCNTCVEPLKEIN